MKLTDVELSAILSEAEGPGLNWLDWCGCAGNVVAQLESPTAEAFDHTQRGRDVSRATQPSGMDGERRWSRSIDADDALAWMRQAGLVRS